MTALATLRAIAFLRRLAGGGPAFEPHPWAIGEIACDWYEPPGRSRAAVVAVHGVTVNGKDDHRLRAFAAALARSGSTCALPTLPALSDLRWDPADVAAIQRIVDAAARRTGLRVTVVGFSFGASLALLAAARRDRAADISYVLAFGAYHSLARISSAYPPMPDPACEAGWDDHVYTHLVQVHRHGAVLGLSPALRDRAEDLLRRYCDAATPQEKRRFFEEHLRPLELVRHDAANRDPAALAAVSPANQLAELACPVGLVHDPDDLLVPASEAHALLDELRRTAKGREHRLLVTRLVSHASSSEVFRAGEALQLARMTAPLVGG